MRMRCDCALRFDTEGLAARARAAGDRALLRSGEQVRTRASALAPRRSGSLAASGTVQPGAGRVTVSFGTPYAAIQHERGDFHHPNGGQAGYLRAALENPATVQTLAGSLAAELGGL